MVAEKVRLARKEVKAAQNLILQAELKARRRVLRRLGYVDSEGVVTVKGRAAAEIQSADELVLTELMFNGAFKVGFWSVSGRSEGASRCTAFCMESSSHIHSGQGGTRQQGLICTPPSSQPAGKCKHHVVSMLKTL